MRPTRWTFAALLVAALLILGASPLIEYPPEQESVALEAGMHQAPIALALVFLFVCGMAIVPTIAVKNANGGRMLINKADYDEDPSKYKLWTAKESKKEPNTDNGGEPPDGDGQGKEPPAGRYVAKRKAGPWFDVIDTESGAPVNKKSLKEADARELATSLNAPE